MSKPRAVLISDVHFNINTLELASASLRAALGAAQSHGVPLIIAGDLNDTKAIMRAECVNAILDILRGKDDTHVIVLIGNHDLINEKADDHSLHFLDDMVDVVRAPAYYSGYDLWLIPYHSNTDALREELKRIKSGSTLIMHQGVQGAFMGEYLVDKTSIESEALANFRVISGHYHRHQDIKCGRPRKGGVGLFTYIGTPYSVTFAEANDGPKGIQLLKDDGTLEQIPLHLRKHVAVSRNYDEVMDRIDGLNPNDLLWLKVHGPASELDKLSKKAIGEKHLGHQTFKLDKIYDDAVKQTVVEIEKLPHDEVLDRLIDTSEETVAQKENLKALWREIL